MSHTPLGTAIINHITHKTRIHILLETLSNDILQVVEYGIMMLIPIYFLEHLCSSVIPNICLCFCIVRLNCLFLSRLKVKPKVILIPQCVDRS